MTSKRASSLPPATIWQGTGGRYSEGPHLYKQDGWYYLLIAEGGTEYGHAVTIARSKTIGGPYLSNPANPILTHANRENADNPIQGTGHADLVQTAGGEWYLVALGFRPVDNHQFLGHETLLAPVAWPAGGWPVVNGGRGPSLAMTVPHLPGPPPTRPDYRQHDDFSEQALGLPWNYLRNPVPANYSLAERPGFLRLRGTAPTPAEPTGTTFVGRQQHFRFAATTTLAFAPTGAAAADLTVLRDPQHCYRLAVRAAGSGRVLELSHQLGRVRAVAAQVPLGPGPVRLRATGTPALYTFSYAQGSHLLAWARSKPAT